MAPLAMLPDLLHEHLDDGAPTQAAAALPLPASLVQAGRRDDIPTIQGSAKSRICDLGHRLQAVRGQPREVVLHGALRLALPDFVHHVPHVCDDGQAWSPRALPSNCLDLVASDMVIAGRPVARLHECLHLLPGAISCLLQGARLTDIELELSCQNELLREEAALAPQDVEGEPHGSEEGALDILLSNHGLDLLEVHARRRARHMPEQRRVRAEDETEIDVKEHAVLCDHDVVLVPVAEPEQEGHGKPYR
mmetsp:Transcript_25538/g.64953  ORF Transcript_25538/g.64953 Transcript_25538/m.64953 type:complete len:250 (+) Transcript_25538:301-1050(+)